MTDNLPVIAHADRAHSPVGGSSAKRVMHCTASVALCAKYPNVESGFAAKGTALHEAIDLIFQGRTKQDTDVIGLTFNGFEITEEDYREAIAPALEMWDALDKELGGIDYFNERRVVFPDIENAFGTVDMVGKARDRTIVWDWKFGRGVAVEAERNEQLMYYAYAAAHTPGTAELFDRDKPIELFIVDEIDDALDTPGLERLMNILDEKAKERGSVFIISHRDLKDWISQIMTVEKENGVTTISETTA